MSPPCRGRQLESLWERLDCGQVLDHDTFILRLISTLDRPIPMSSGTIVLEEAGPAGSASMDSVANRIGPWSFLLLSTWCGLVAGLLEVGVTVLAQGNARPESARAGEPSFRLADPSGQSGDLLCSGRAALAAGPVGTNRSLVGPSVVVRFDPARPHLGGLFPDLRPGRVPSGTGCRDAARPGAGAASRRLAAAGPAQLSRRRRPGDDPGGIALGAGSNQGVARGGSAVAATGKPQRALDRDGHGRRRTSETLRLRPSHQLDHRGAGVPRHSLRSGAGHLIVDTAIACEPVHRPMASRAFRRLDHAPRWDLSDPVRVPGVARVCDGRFHRQLLVLRVQLGAGPRLHRLSRLHLPPAHRIQVGRADQSSPGWAPIGRAIHGRLARCRSLETRGGTPRLALQVQSENGVGRQSRAPRLAVSDVGSRSVPFSPS